ncbi:MAG: acetyl-CoA carboxylase biotin carboxyl carrier protein [Saprospiraceae bacterium]|nr:acetyl-CoA carboxylase biotin carboxyl carrier protein [Saprospiraceae bacterium]
MEFKQITDLVKLVSKSDLIEFKLKEGDFEINILTNKHGKASPKESTQAMVAPVASIYSQPSAPPAAPPTSAPAQDPQTSPKTAESDETSGEGTNYLEISSPMVGTFYRSASPDKPPFIKVGDTIEKEDVVCIIEAMKLYNEIESEISGKVVKVMVEDATPVEYDQVLFLIEP